MAKRGRESFTSPRSLLSEEEYEEYKTRKQNRAREILRRQIKEDKVRDRREERTKRYDSSRTGRVGKFFGKGLSYKKGNITRRLYRQPPKTAIGLSRGSYSGRGRPKGSYDSRYAKYGGVYGYRKYLAQQYRLQRLKQISNQELSPRQRVILSRQEEMQIQRRRENPSTGVYDGNVNTDVQDFSSIINKFSNI